MSEPIQRYRESVTETGSPLDPDTHDVCYELRPDDSGEWCKFADVVPLLKRIALLEEMQESSGGIQSDLLDKNFEYEKRIEELERELSTCPKKCQCCQSYDCRCPSW